jgi:glycosyltransferase involved in cell wall biosynthesis
MNNISNPLPKVIHYQREIPHYKIEFFKNLSISAKYNYTIILLTDSSYTYPGSLSIDEIKDYGISCVVIQGRTVKLFRKKFVIYPEFIKYIITQKPKVIMEGGVKIFNSIVLDSIMFFYLKLFYGTKFVLGFSGFGSNGGYLKKFFRILKFKLILGYNDVAVTYGDNAKYYLAKHYFNSENIYVAYNSLDSALIMKIKQKLLTEKNDWYYDFREKLSLKINERVILFLARITPNKKLDILIEAFHKLQNKMKDIKLLIVGDGKDKKKYQDDIANLGMESNVIFIDGCYDDIQVAKYFFIADMVVYPGWISLSTQFAMIIGVPFITVPLGNELEYCIDGYNCLHFEIDNPNELADKVEYLMDNDELKKRFILNSYKIIDEKANIDNKIAGYRNAILRLLN